MSEGVLNDTIVRNLAATISVPVVFCGYVDTWPMRQWSVEKWTEVFGEPIFPFRCVNKNFQSDEPCWERKCTIKKMTFKKFAESALSGDEAMYFDYKYLHEWFSEEHELFKEISWDLFGYTDKGASDTTLWVGSGGAHTPAHQDTYGVNIVTQVYGKKRWILFPPESTGLKSTRVPYEESSVYSELNFYSPKNLHVFKELTGARVVELSAGDALVLPHKWWHYVQNEDPINISLNMWLPHEQDKSSRMDEAAIKMFVAQLCKDLPQETVKLIINPNEIDILETPQSELLLQLEAAYYQCLEDKMKHKKVGNKRQKVSEEDNGSNTVEKEYDLEALLANPDNKMKVPPTITGQELVQLIEENKNRYENGPKSSDNEDHDISQSFHKTKNVINTFCEGDVMYRFRPYFESVHTIESNSDDVDE